jgi:hypothetical protein
MKDKDIEQIRQIVREELQAALSRTITVERSARQQGEIEKKTVEEQWNILDWMVYYMPYIEAALRGGQETTDHVKNGMTGLQGKIDALGQTMISLHDAARHIVHIGQALEVVEHQPHALEEYDG